MTQIFEYINIAIMNIRHNKKRSLLTMIGIIIGITSVIMVISIGNGVRNQINEELNGMGGNQIYFNVNNTGKDNPVSFDKSDFDAILNQINHVKGVSPMYSMYGTAKAPKTTMNLHVTGGTPSLKFDKSEPIIRGRYFNESDFDIGKAVCIVSESNARAMFGTADVVGLSFEINAWDITQEVTIIGIRKDPDSTILNMFESSKNIEAEVPYTFLSYKFGALTDEFHGMNVYCESPAYAAEVATKAKNLLESRHHCSGENQIVLDSFSDYSSEFDNIMGIVALFVSLVATISLLVGGIGVMNIMLVSVTERTREIGIRKALGARTKSIMWQFLAEAGIITLLGGIIGIVISVVGSCIVCLFISIKLSISIWTIIIASIFSCGVGVFFGLYPAKKAASLSPIEALHYE